MRAHPKVLVDLLCSANIGLGHRLADEALMLLHMERATFHALLSPAHVRAILDQLKRLDELNGHWVEEFVAFCSREHADACAQFFMDRVEHAAATENWKHRPSNHGPYGHVPLKFREATQFGALLIQVSTWMAKPNASYLFRYRSAELFNCMFSPFDDTVLSHLRDWLRTADEAGLGVIAHVLREGSNDLVFRERGFILQLLKRCQQFGDKSYRGACSDLYAAAISGMRSGTPGVPFQQDIDLRDNARAALTAIPRFTPGYDLYQDLLRHAEHSIKRSHKEGEQFDDE